MLCRRRLGYEAEVPASAKSSPISGTQFAGLLIGTVMIVGGLNSPPGLALGPSAEHSAVQAGIAY